MYLTGHDSNQYMYKVHDSVQLPIGREMGDNLPLPGYNDDILGVLKMDFIDIDSGSDFKKLASSEVRLARPDSLKDFGKVQIVKATGKTVGLKKCAGQRLTINADYFVLPVSAFGTKGFECKNTKLIKCNSNPKAKDFTLNTNNLKSEIARLLRERFGYSGGMNLRASNKQQRIEVPGGKLVCSKT